PHSEISGESEMYAGVIARGTELLNEPELLDLARRCSGKVLCTVEDHPLGHLEPGQLRPAHVEHLVFGACRVRRGHHHDATDFAPTIVDEPDREHLTNGLV